MLILYLSFIRWLGRILTREPGAAANELAICFLPDAVYISIRNCAFSTGMIYSLQLASARGFFGRSAGR
jgi:hypothetical protein